MNTYITATGSGGKGSLPANEHRRFGYIEQIVDWDVSSGYEVVNAGFGTILDDLVNVLLVPQGCVLLGAGYEILTASNNNSNVNLAFTGRADLDTAVDFMAEAGTMEYFTEGDDQVTTDTFTYLSVKQKFNGTVITGRVRFFANVLDIS